jgi:dienelactone hydrolase
VLYKPESFDSTKRYPVILHYYERKSDGLHAYLAPQLLGGNGCVIDIPRYVSHGYLIFTPDIHFRIGETGQSVVNAVVSAADHLASMPWVDGGRMGLQGCSFGGSHTNYLVTHSGRFAAAVSSSGSSNLISDYGSLTGDGVTVAGALGFEVRQTRLGASLWERPDVYIRNSPILQADRVTTPLLLMHTTIDGITPFGQALELFTGLRRLGKKAWMLQYDGGHNHGVWGAEGRDFSIRMAQFFDHYLKGAPPPKWMTEGIPARLKGIETGLELDTSGKVPGSGLVNADTAGHTATAGDDAVSAIITLEEIDPVVFPGGEPSAAEPAWATLTETITKKYGAAHAHRAVLRARVFWYWGKERWPAFSKSLVEFAERYGIERSRIHVNNASWRIFEHSDDPAELNAAASWMARVVQQEPDDQNALDTYANLLYKTGRVAEGIAWEEKALAVARAKQIEDLAVFRETLAKMKQGEPTWPTE